MNKGHMIAPMELITELEDKIDSVKGIAIPLMKDNWVLDNTTSTYKQTVTVDGLKIDSNPIIVLSTVNDEPTDAELDAFGCLEDETVIGDGSITFVASEIPAISFTVIAKGVMAGEGTAIADVTELVTKCNELEDEIINLKNGKIVAIAPADITWGEQLAYLYPFFQALSLNEKKRSYLMYGDEKYHANCSNTVDGVFYAPSLGDNIGMRCLRMSINKTVSFTLSAAKEITINDTSNQTSSTQLILYV